MDTTKAETTSIPPYGQALATLLGTDNPPMFVDKDTAGKVDSIKFAEFMNGARKIDYGEGQEATLGKLMIGDYAANIIESDPEMFFSVLHAPAAVKLANATGSERLISVLAEHGEGLDFNELIEQIEEPLQAELMIGLAPYLNSATLKRYAEENYGLDSESIKKAADCARQVININRNTLGPYSADAIHLLGGRAQNSDLMTWLEIHYQERQCVPG